MQIISCLAQTFRKIAFFQLQIISVVKQSESLHFSAAMPSRPARFSLRKRTNAVALVQIVSALESNFKVFIFQLQRRLGRQLGGADLQLQVSERHGMSAQTIQKQIQT